MKSSALAGICATLLLFAAGTAAQDPPQGDSIRNRLDAVGRRLTEFRAAIAPQNRYGPSAYAEAQLQFTKATLTASGADAWYQTPASAEKATLLAEQAVARLDKPPAAGTRKGFQERAYLCEIDESAQPYFLYVPARYEANRAWPLLVFLHGYYPGLNANNWHDLMYSTDLQDVCEREGFILLMPFGRSNTEFMGVGESDVLKTMGFVRAEYNVDPQRIILSGASMGGSGAYSIACHRPDLFAGVMVITARVDYYEWMGIVKESLPRFKQIQMDADYARDLLPNLRHVPVLIFHGEHDTTVQISQARLMQRLMRDLGQQCELVIFPGMGHIGTWSMAFLHEKFTDMLRNARSPQAPREVRLRTYSVKHARAYWVQVERIAQWGQAADLRAEVSQEGIISLRVENADALRLGPVIPGVADPHRASVSVNGVPVRSTPLPDGGIRILLDGAPPAGGLAKRPGLCGPIREAYDGPFVIVYPSRDDAETKEDRIHAGRLAREWYAYAQGAPRMMPDNAVTDEHARAWNLALVGSPETNLFLARIADKLPLRFSKDRYAIGESVFPRDGNGVQMIYPNPIAPNRYVLIVHGVQWGPKLQANHKLDFLPDFIIYTDRTADDGTWFPTNEYLCAGYFDSDWRLSPKSTWALEARPFLH